MEPVVGFEPTTDGLQNRCSTTELNWHQIIPGRFPTSSTVQDRTKSCKQMQPLGVGYVRPNIPNATAVPSGLDQGGSCVSAKAEGRVAQSLGPFSSILWDEGPALLAALDASRC